MFLQLLLEDRTKMFHYNIKFNIIIMIEFNYYMKSSLRKIDWKLDNKNFINIQIWIQISNKLKFILLTLQDKHHMLEDLLILEFKRLQKFKLNPNIKL